VFKKDRKNKGKVYDAGLFGLSRHINYFGYTLWRTGYALAAGGWTWGAVTASFFVYDFNFRAIPVLQHYLEENVSCCADYLDEDAFTDKVYSTVQSTSNTSRPCRTSSCRSFTK
jgi:hypothetical protein